PPLSVMVTVTGVPLLAAYGSLSATPLTRVVWIPLIARLPGALSAAGSEDAVPGDDDVLFGTIFISTGWSGTVTCTELRLLAVCTAEVPFNGSNTSTSLAVAPRLRVTVCAASLSFHSASQ